MMSYIFSFMIICGFFVAALFGRMEQLSAATLNEAQKGVELLFSLVGTYCMWGGMMEIAVQSGLTKKLAKAMMPITKRLFPNLNPQGEAIGAITMNMVANILGLGNAATPLGIKAMQAMEREQHTRDTATNAMALFVIVNTASLQLIPTTTARLRALAGCANPLDILPAVWLSSLASIMVGITMAVILGRLVKS